MRDGPQWREVETIGGGAWLGGRPRVYLMWTDRRADEALLGNPVVGWYGFGGDTTGAIKLVVDEASGPR